MPDPGERADDRLELWRRTIALFEKVRQEEGAFHAAGYDRYVIEPKLGADPEDGRRFNPDLVGASEDRFVVCEVSISDHKDLEDLEKYRDPELTGFLRGELGLPADAEPGSEPVYLCLEADADLEVPEEFPALELSTWTLLQMGVVHDENLRRELEEWGGFTVHVPRYSLRAVPESPIKEVKRKIAALFYKYGAAEETIDADDVTEDLLGDFYENTPRRARTRLQKKVAQLLPQAADNLDKYAEWDSREDTLTFQELDNAPARKAFKGRVDTWIRTEIRPLEDYGETGVTFDPDDDVDLDSVDPENHHDA